ncbi:hypothetical protein GCM10022288_11210 [Gryllotalpicola kribbensis]|jgi:hypothetical protein|uniref:Uncharacterized protein n=1 Tax=Gryllotalpicola kribbensis TaxID=993084 RepID=A0ABP8ANK7_9MICO
MTIRKYVLSPRLYASALAVLPVVKATRKPQLGQRSWVLWAGWALGTAAALITIREESARRVSTDRR